MMATGENELAELALKLVQEAEEEGAHLRIIGSLACRLHCMTRPDLLHQLRREPPRDLDLASDAPSLRGVSAVMAGHGFKMSNAVALASGYQQLFYARPSDGLGVDVYIDRLNYCHVVGFEDRLQCDSPTLPLAELLLAKLQVVQITEKDLKDIAALLLAHKLAPASDADTINLGRVVETVGDDWGFYYTATQNLDRLGPPSPFPELPPSDVELLQQTVAQLRRHVDETPKSRRWRIRARIGPRVRWYQDVEEKPRPSPPATGLMR
jgi:hypothetical protein